ncbi:hypothetical protein BDQ17DRAFT_1333240 [Cyathus striatus]|nr:hypothetical protein BDQ17DRAFT_1333240 [Cyathus striatus]
MPVRTVGRGGGEERVGVRRGWGQGEGGRGEGGGEERVEAGRQWNGWRVPFVIKLADTYASPPPLRTIHTSAPSMCMCQYPIQPLPGPPLSPPNPLPHSCVPPLSLSPSFCKHRPRPTHRCVVVNTASPTPSTLALLRRHSPPLTPPSARQGHALCIGVPSTRISCEVTQTGLKINSVNLAFRSARNQSTKDNVDKTNARKHTISSTDPTTQPAKKKGRKGGNDTQKKKGKKGKGRKSAMQHIAEDSQAAPPVKLTNAEQNIIDDGTSVAPPK